ncbi:XisI protein [Baaleninema simplex]|uniref:XisI protein n=1 Tax=Baaleninema simplex TaxID=2862350 RepID=UPI00034567EE|nr:XisI protein [Baaleninema simplex]
MDRLEKMRSAIESLLTELSRGTYLNLDIETELVFDRDRDRYLLVNLGWQEDLRIYDSVLHLEIRDDRIWIQRNQTDVRIADALKELGIEGDRIVVGVVPPSYRALAENSAS